MWTIFWHEHPEKKLNFLPYSNKSRKYKNHTKVWGDAFRGPIDPVPSINSLNYKILLDGRAHVFPTTEARMIWDDLTAKGWVSEKESDNF
jgi:hypothetical protein